MTVEELRGAPGRLDAVVAALLGITRADAQRAIAAGRVRVDGRQRPKSFRLMGNERLVISPSGPDELVGEDGPVPVRFEDEHLAVVAKPAGLVTHPTATRRGGTLVNRLIGAGTRLSALGGPLRPGIVHRLDAGTSGLLIVAKSDAAYEELVAMMRRHEVDRRYLALARGSVEHDAFAVDAPLGRRAARIVVDATEGRSAETRFEVRERLPRTTLLVATPTTGRTHQIRVHLSSIGHPIVGDRAYGGGGDDADRIALRRPFLHAWRIAFHHPITGARIELEEPLPPDLRRALATAREDGA